jgi:MFS family permease
MSGITAASGLFVAVTGILTVAAAIRGTWSPCGLSMISAINPLSERSRGHRFWLTAAWFIVGAVAGGAVLGGAAAVGALLWSLVPVGTAVTAGIGALCCVVALASDTSAVRFRLPEHPRQVNERWLGGYRRWVYAAGFGVQIGCGFATYIMTAAVYLMAALGVLSGVPAFALALGVLFGLVRGVAVLLSCGVGDPAGLRRLHHRLDLLAPWSLRAAVAAQLLAGIALGALAAGPAGAAVVVLFVVAGGIRGRLGRSGQAPSQAPHQGGEGVPAESLHRPPFAAGATLAINEEKSCLSRR